MAKFGTEILNLMERKSFYKYAKAWEEIGDIKGGLTLENAIKAITINSSYGFNTSLFDFMIMAYPNKEISTINLNANIQGGYGNCLEIFVEPFSADETKADMKEWERFLDEYIDVIKQAYAYVQGEEIEDMYLYFANRNIKEY